MLDVRLTDKAMDVFENCAKTTAGNQRAPLVPWGSEHATEQLMQTGLMEIWLDCRAGRNRAGMTPLGKAFAFDEFGITI